MIDAGPSGAARRFVPRFSVSSSSPAWRGSGGAAGANALLLCEYLSPPVLVKELYALLLGGGFGPHARAGAPALYWSLVVWFVSFALPVDALSYLAREPGADAEAAALAAALDRWRPLLRAAVEVGAAAKRGAAVDVVPLLAAAAPPV
jgi:hypothetical protein